MNRSRFALLLLMIIYGTTLLAVGKADDEPDFDLLNTTDETNVTAPREVAPVGKSSPFTYYGPDDELNYAEHDYGYDEDYGYPDTYAGEGVAEEPIAPLTTSPVKIEDLPKVVHQSDDAYDDYSYSAYGYDEIYDLDAEFYVESQAKAIAAPHGVAIVVPSAELLNDYDYDYEADYRAAYAPQPFCPLAGDDLYDFEGCGMNRCLRPYAEQVDHCRKPVADKPASGIDYYENCGEYQYPGFAPRGKYRDIARNDVVDELDCDVYCKFLCEEYGYYLPLTAEPKSSPLVIVPPVKPVAEPNFDDALLDELQLADDEAMWDCELGDACHAVAGAWSAQNSAEQWMKSNWTRFLDTVPNFSSLWNEKLADVLARVNPRTGNDLADAINMQSDGLTLLARDRSVENLANTLGRWFQACEQAVGSLARQTLSTPPTFVESEYPIGGDEAPFIIRGHRDLNLELDDF